ncbi:hypothetical protein, partial [Pseudomonas abyssi]|uniref:hypothetical protein n=1 Tax=Pseudomonas abyssi TaxID=170540 RepID=UPI001C2B9103
MIRLPTTLLFSATLLNPHALHAALAVGWSAWLVFNRIEALIISLNLKPYFVGGCLKVLNTNSVVDHDSEYLIAEKGRLKFQV